MAQPETAFLVSLAFEKAQLPPFSDILLLGRKCPIGMEGMRKSMEFLVPNNYEVFPIDADPVEAMVINRNILKRMPVEKIVGILKERVLPFVSETEIVRVDFTVRVSYQGIVVGE